MTIQDLKITSEDYLSKDISGLPDRPSEAGMSATDLKARFDAATKHIVQPKFNQLIEILNSQEGADNIGITPIDGVAGYTVQQILSAVKLLLDDKQSIEQSNKDVDKKFDKTEAQALVREVTFSESSGVFTITKYDGSVKTIDTAIEKVALDVRLDGQQFVLTLVDGTEQRVDISKFLTETEVKNSDTITLAIESGVIVARLASGSVTMAHLNPEVTAYIEAKEQSAANSAASASVSEQNALNSANSAEQSHQNAKICQEQACLCAAQAEISRQAASTSESNAKASEQAAKQSETKAATSEANAKESEEKAATSERNASDYEQGALQNAQTAEQAAETAVNAMNNASASEQNAKASETASQTNKEASDTSASSAAESARAAAESAKRAEEEANRAADNAGGDFATISELQAHENAENPHNIDAETVGLENVPNVATNDQTPTYEVPAENAELTSGEKLSIAFGKIAKAVSSFISHLANRENPHNVTKEQVGLGKVDNTADSEKPVSTAQATAISDAKSAGTTAQSNLNTHIADKDNPHGVTAKQVSALPLDGSVPMSGGLTISRSGWIGIRMRNTTSGREGRLASASNGDTVQLLNYTDDNNLCSINLSKETNDLQTMLRLSVKKGGHTEYYNIFGEHNKPTGSYTGNGDGTKRVIDIGGIGDTLVIYTHQSIGFVNSSGGVFFRFLATTKDTVYLNGSCSFEDGIFTITSTSAVINYANAEYFYRVL